jgi:hypothetical protein
MSFALLLLLLLAPVRLLLHCCTAAALLNQLVQVLTSRAWSCSCIAAVSSASGGAPWHSARSSPHSCADTLRDVRAASCRRQHKYSSDEARQLQRE